MKTKSIKKVGYKGPTCASCKFLDATDILKPFCRRYPAQLAQQGTQLLALYPIVTTTIDWCGEYLVMTK